MANPNSTTRVSADIPVTPREEAGGYKLPALGVLSEITASLSTEGNLEALLGRFLGTLIRLAGAMAGTVRVISADETHLRLVAALGLPAEVVEQERYVPLPCGACGGAAQGDEITQTADLSVCAGRTSSQFFGEKCKKIVAVPLQYKGKVLGVYTLFMPVNRDVPDEVALLFRSISEHLGMALENARLTRENLRITLMSERHMLASEMHDSLAQTLAYMKMRMAVLKDALENRDHKLSEKYLEDVSGALEEAYGSVRQLLTSFRSQMDPRGLLHALRDMVEKFHDRTGILLDYSNDAPDLHLGVDQEVQVFHIVQEALTNVAKHSRARHARLRISMKGDRYEFAVEDDGKGIPLEAPGEGGLLTESQYARFGLNIMKERAQRLGGEIRIETVKGKGTRVSLSFPARRAEARA
ncbi:MAG: GAF domain-containing protein [Betaproteobacteria bacterium]|nr:GAF domain-containing protein [Betaproteobacteria bacterium]